MAPSRTICLLLAAASPVLLCAQTFTGDGATIVDNGSTLEIPLAVSGLTSVLDTDNFGLEQVCITINYSWLADLNVSIVAPDGTEGLLTSNQGGSTDHYANTCFRSDATYSISQGSPPFGSTYRPQGDMGTINNGQDGNGVWKLRVQDLYPFGDFGAVASWSLTFGNDPATPFPFHASNLPIVVINTNGQSIPEDGKITVDMGIVYNGPGMVNLPTGPFNDYNGLIGIDLHGNTSSYMSPKKSFNVELRDPFGQDLNVPILGMPAQSDWVLVANYFDKSLMNNTLSYHLARAMGRYAPRTRDVEVVLNGEYMGVYALVEKIKRGPGRLNLAKLDPDETFGDDLTGGYILCVDRDEGPSSGFHSSPPPASVANAQEVFIQYKYPKPDVIVADQKAYIQAYVDSFETALAGAAFMDPAQGYRAYADMSSFVDLFLLNELSRNVDGYRLSSYLYKDKGSNGGKLHAGPAWDYDLAWGNANYCNGSSITGWAYLFGNVCAAHDDQVPFWWARLQADSVFVQAVRCRWEELRDSVLSPAYVAAYADSVAALLDQAQQRNFTKWPILGTYVWPNPQPVPTTYAGEVQELKAFMDARWLWMDQNLPGQGCLTTALAASPASAIGPPWPNPFTDEIAFRAAAQGPLEVKLLDPTGRTVMQQSLSPASALHRIHMPKSLAPGSYMLIAATASGAFSAYRLQH